VALARDVVSDDDFDELSESDFEILNKIWDKYGHFSEFDLAEYTHRNCPEWEDPGNSSTPIPYSRVFRFLNKENSERLAHNIQERKNLDRVLFRVK
jgi:hypothetical protein